jgi:glutamate dehydrogenase/leucine dehydrogenase
VAEFDKGEAISNTDLWSTPCDWLIPAALGSVISREKNAASVNCKVVVEAANSPVTPVGEKILEDRGITVLPDMLVNAGGVVVSYFEWTQNLQQHPWTLEHVNRGLHSRMQTAYRSVRQLVEARRVSWRTAALAIALERVAEAERLRGGW